MEALNQNLVPVSLFLIRENVQSYLLSRVLGFEQEGASYRSTIYICGAFLAPPISSCFSNETNNNRYNLIYSRKTLFTKNYGY